MYSKPLWLLRLALVPALLAAVPVAAQDAPSLPDSPAGRQVAELLRVIRDGREESVRAFVQGSMSSEYNEMPMDAHLQLFRRFKEGFGNAPIRAVRTPDAHQIEVVLATETGRTVMAVTVEAAPPHRVAGIRVGPDFQSPPSTLSEADLAEVVDSTAAFMERIYVDPDTGRLIADHLRARADAGAYRGITDPRAFAQALTRDLRAVNEDGHLSVFAGPPPRRPRGQSPGDAGDGGAGAYRYLDRVEVLEGNVGYLKFGGIPGGREALDEVERALRAMEGTDAMIIDLRGAPGGSADMANFLISYFAQPDLLALATVQRGKPDTTFVRTLTDVGGTRRADVPLFILIDQGSASAAEHIPFVLQNLGRATLVGERTAGASRNNSIMPTTRGFALSVSISRVWDPCTGRQWEKTGVIPDIRVPSAEALGAAVRAVRDPARRRPVPLGEPGCRSRASR
ncbi:MAG TPA: S41 family peptidase [Longimicrobium sp.]|jgi:hypothetical protein|nr:S41 family peptidase [Longimicrobium sp.]